MKLSTILRTNIIFKAERLLGRLLDIEPVTKSLICLFDIPGCVAYGGGNRHMLE
jgi:hypothetical protein